MDVSLKFCVLALLLAFISSGVSNGYKILGIFPLPGKSHMVMYDTLMKGLAEKGHEVDVYSFLPPKKPIPGLTHFMIETTQDSEELNFTMDTINELMGNSFDTITFIVKIMGQAVCKQILDSPTIRNLKNSGKKYDVLVTEIFSTDCMLGFAHIFKIPSIGMISSVNLPWASDRMGTIDNPSYIPTYFSGYTSKMNFFERLYNTISLFIYKRQYEVYTDQSNEDAREFFGPDLPDLRELARKTSLVLVNSHASISFSRPVSPNFVEVGGLHIETPKVLPEDLKKSIEVSSSGKYRDGVIYLSMGSMVLTETLPLPILKAMMNTFKELPSYKVVWKASREKMPPEVEIPDNIEFHDWLPQLDILCNENIKLFVTHGGLMGTQEAVYCGVPRLGIPLFADQELNMKQAEMANLAIKVKYEDIPNSFAKAVKILLTDPKYKDNAKLISQLFKERPMPPLDTAIYWVEYVIKTNGAHHLRTVGADLPWYQYYLIDVAVTLILFVGLILTVLYKIVMSVLKIVFRKKPKSD